MYVNTTPPTILETAEVEPNEKRIPKNIDIPLKKEESEPGIYGKITMAAKTITKKRTILYVGTAHSDGNLTNVIVSRSISPKINLINLITYLVTKAITSIEKRWGRNFINEITTFPNGLIIYPKSVDAHVLVK
jgi:hypothetical protein